MGPSSITCNQHRWKRHIARFLPVPQVNMLMTFLWKLPCLQTRKTDLQTWIPCIYCLDKSNILHFGELEHFLGVAVVSRLCVAKGPCVFLVGEKLEAPNLQQQPVASAAGTFTSFALRSSCYPSCKRPWKPPKSVWWYCHPWRVQHVTTWIHHGCHVPRRSTTNLLSMPCQRCGGCMFLKVEVWWMKCLAVLVVGDVFRFFFGKMGRIGSSFPKTSIKNLFLTSQVGAFWPMFLLIYFFSEPG